MSGRMDNNVLYKQMLRAAEDAGISQSMARKRE